MASSLIDQPETGRRAPARSIPAIAICMAFGMISACSPLYLPNAVHTSAMEKAGELHAAAYFGTSVGSINASAAILDHILLAGSFSFDPIEDSLPQDNSLHHIGHWFWEGGGGWYSWTGENTKIELIAGFGMGRAASTSADSTDEYGVGQYRVEGDYRRVSAQINIAESSGGRTTAVSRGVRKRGSRLAEQGIVFRVSYVWFDNLERAPLPPLRPSAIFFEPVLYVRGGGERIGAELQFGMSLMSASKGGRFHTEWLFLNVGIHCMLEDLW